VSHYFGDVLNGHVSVYAPGRRAVRKRGRREVPENRRYNVVGTSAELPPGTFCTLRRELSSLRRTVLPLEELSGVKERPMILIHADRDLHAAAPSPLLARERLIGCR